MDKANKSARSDRIVASEAKHQMVLRGFYQKVRGKSLETEFGEFGIGTAETSQIFDEIDEKFGAALLCGDHERMDAAAPLC